MGCLLPLQFTLFQSDNSYVCGRRCATVSLRPVRQGFHPALLSGVTYSQSTRYRTAFRLQTATTKDVRVRGMRSHGLTAGTPLPASASPSSVQPRTCTIARQTALQVRRRVAAAALCRVKKNHFVAYRTTVAVRRCPTQILFFQRFLY